MMIKCLPVLLAVAVSVSTLKVNSEELESRGDSRQARYHPYQALGKESYSQELRTPLEPKNLPEWGGRSKIDREGTANSSRTSNLSRAGTALKGEVGAVTVPVATRLTLVLEYPVDAKTSKPGDIFEAHVRDDLILGTSLLLPQGSLVRGRVVEVTRPRLISRAGKIGLKLEQIVTPVGEVIPLDAALEFRKGVTNQRGQLDPGTSLGSRVQDSVRSVTGMKSKGVARTALAAANIATLGAPAVATVIGSSVVGLFRSGDNISFTPGQELEVLLTNDLGVQIN